VNPFAHEIGIGQYITVNGAGPALVTRKTVYAAAAVVDLYVAVSSTGETPAGIDLGEHLAVAIVLTGATAEPTAFPGWGPGWRITTL
jgi:hypothetical protein